MRLTGTVAAALTALIVLGPAPAGADDLHQQLLKMQIEQRNLGDLGVTPTGDLLTPEARKKLADEIALRRALKDLTESRFGKPAPGLQLRAMRVLDGVSVPDSVPADAALKFIIEKYKQPDTQDMKAPFGTSIDRNGKGFPGDVTALFPGSSLFPMPTADAGMNNAPPDPGKLPFSISFVVELRIGPGGKTHCSGSLIARDLVLTARHCMFDGDGHLIDGQDAQVRSVNGGAVIHGRAGAPWVPNASGNSWDNDIALLKLASPFDGQLTLAKVSGALKEELWVLMGGIGVTDKTSFSVDRWNTAYVSHPQPVEFKAYYFPGMLNMARIPWNDARLLASSQCDGDSGGPVFVVGRNGVPLVVGVLSAAALNSATGAPSGCAASKEASFVNLGHPLIAQALCPALKDAGGACEAKFDYAPVVVATK